MEDNYKRVSELVRLDKLRILSILSPARSASTITSKALANSPAIQGECSQPFHLAYSNPYTPPLDREEMAYGYILDTYESIAMSEGARPITIIVKEMARNIGIGSQLERWNAVCQKHLVTLRNPLLSSESLIRVDLNFIEDMPEALHKLAIAFAEEHGYEPTPLFLEKYVNVFAKHRGYEDPSGLGQHWRTMVNAIKDKRDYRDVDDILQAFEPYFELNAHQKPIVADLLSNITDVTAARYGFGSLNSFAQQQGYANWQAMLIANLGQEQPKLDAFRPLLDKYFVYSITGWENIGYISDKLEGVAVASVDSTVLRLLEPETMQGICEFLGIDYSDNIVDWSGTEVATISASEHIESSYKKVYGRADFARSIERPFEAPIGLDRLPEGFREHIESVAMPVYVDLLGRDMCIRAEGMELREILGAQANSRGHGIQEVDPVFSYAFIATDNHADENEKRRLSGKIRDAQPEFVREFDLVDQSVQKAALQARSAAVTRA